MKRIDLHIHTVATPSDSKGFEFDPEVLKEYVSSAKLDAIAITNHNGFYRDNYDAVKDTLDIPVFPGAELNISTAAAFGHVLVIADPDDIDELAEGMAIFAEECPDGKSHVSWERVTELFPSLKKWLVIPHYRKAKRIDSPTLAIIESMTGCDALEVSNAKKWLVESKNSTKSIVTFSDCRPGLRMPGDDPDDNARRYAYGYTYVQWDGISFQSLKKALVNPKNVSVFQDNRHFEILPEALPVSSRINVILGERSSGKTFTLKRILDAYDESDYLYIEQFEITNKAKKDVFDEEVKAEDIRFFDSYFKPLQEAIDDYCDCDLGSMEDAVRAYCTAVVKFAESPTDKYSDRPIYNADDFNLANDDALERNDADLRKAARTLASNDVRHDVIEQYVDSAALLELEAKLRALMKDGYVMKWQKRECDRLIAEIKKELSKKSSRRPLPSSSPLRDYFAFCYRERRLTKLLDALSRTADLKSSEEYKYLKKRTRQSCCSSREARRGFGGQIPAGTNVAGLFSRDITSEQKLRIIREFDKTTQRRVCHLLFSIHSRIVLNDGSGASLSGGQRAEYLLLHRIADSAGKDIVLIDEPESSFDNPFLNHEVISLLNDVARHSTIFLVTHNNTLGVSLLPDCIIYTEKTKDGEYRIYSGELAATELTDTHGNKCSRAERLLFTMEAGRDAYLNRRNYYEVNDD